LTKFSPQYSEKNCLWTITYYEAIQIVVSQAGKYSFVDTEGILTYGFFVYTTFQSIQSV